MTPRSPVATPWLHSGIIRAILPLLLLCLLSSVASAQFGYNTNTGTVTITNYNGTNLSVTIPSTINGLLVTSIGYPAFFHSGVTSVSVPEGVTTIGLETFMFCTNLNNITLPDSLTNIENFAFYSCASLTNLVLPGKLIQIGSSAFDGCNQLSLVTLPDSVTNLGDAAFSDCTNLTAIAVTSTNLLFKSVDGVLLNKNQTTLIQCPGSRSGSYIVTNSVTSINSGAFASCAGLTSIILPAGVTNIGAWAFSFCSGLTHLMLPNGVTSIDDYAFTSCSGLIDFTIPDSVTDIGAEAFYGCANLTSMIIPAGITRIEQSTFLDCSSLTNVIIPDSVSYIGTDAFSSCRNLKSITIPSSVATIGQGAFEFCINLTGIYFNGGPPAADPTALDYDTVLTVYYLLDTTGWGTNFCGRPTWVWFLPKPDDGSNFGVRSNQFIFPISWSNSLTVIVEACTNLTAPFWLPVGTNTLTNGSAYFNDPQWTNYPHRFYRFRSP